jgi:hypothetical protein
MSNENLASRTKLENTWAKIEKILEEDGVGAVVHLHTPGLSNYYLHMTTPYSGFIREAQGLRLRVRLKEDCNGDVELRNKKISDSYNLLETVLGTHEYVSDILASLISHLDDKVEHVEQPTVEKPNSTGFSES